MKLAYWMYAGPAHIGTLRVASSFKNVHAISLNLAAAVQLIAYDWREALGGFGVRSSTSEPSLADARAVAGMLQHLEQALVAVEFLDPAAPKKLMPRLNQLINRANLSVEEIHILRGVAKAILKKSAPAHQAGEN